MFRLPVPVFLCLGNHDVTRRDALDLWLNEAPEFFPGGRPAFSIRSRDCTVHVVPTHWHEVPYFWGLDERVHFLREEWQAFATALAGEAGGRQQILCTHCPVLGVPCAQTGLAEPFHGPSAEFAQPVLDLARSRSSLHCVFGAHSHVNMHVEQDGVHFVTVSALVETPFEFKLIEAGPGHLRLTTHGLLPAAQFRPEYDFNRTYVQGRERDRQFEDLLS